MEKEQNENTEGKVSFFISQKVDAFLDSYMPAKDDTDADEIFDDARLRKYFQAWPRPTGDPLIEYIDELEKAGFKFKTIITGEPAICVKYKFD